MSDREGGEVANLVASSSEGKWVEWPPLLRGNAEFSFTLDLGALVPVFPHLKPTATAWRGEEGVRHRRGKERRAGAAV